MTLADVKAIFAAGGLSINLAPNGENE